MNSLRTVWRLWAKAIGEKAHKKDHVADQVAVIRTVIFTTYLITNCFIVAGVIRHWNKQTIIEVQVYDNIQYENPHTKGRNCLGVGGDARTEGVYHTATAKNCTGEFE